MTTHDTWLNEVNWQEGLVPAIAQDHETGRILMVAWMNREALRLTAETKFAHYWSRSRKKMWKKGESSGHLQQVHEIRLDCDEDVIVLQVKQEGGMACHTGRESCFYRQLHLADDGQQHWQITDAVIKDPALIYAADSGTGHSHG